MDDSATVESASPSGKPLADPDCQVLNNPVRSVFTAFIQVITVPALAALIFSHLGRWFYIAELMGNFQLQLGIAVALLPVVLWFRKKRMWALISLAGVAITLANPLSSYVPDFRQPLSGANRLRLMSFNVYAGNSDFEMVRNVITQAKPDVVVLLEYTPFLQPLQHSLAAEYPFQVVEPRYHGFGIALFSRFPLSEKSVNYLTLGPIPLKTTYPFPEKDDPAIDVTVDVKGHKIRIIGVHLFNPIDPPLYPERNKQLLHLSKMIEIRPEMPTVVMGDFNCTPWSSYFRQLLANSKLRDSRHGFGYQGSWPSAGNLVSIPIDHFLVSKEIRVEDRSVGESGGSDHHSVVAEISWDDKK